MAIAILGWPIASLSPEIAAQVLDGSRAICAEAGIPLAGGHSIDSAEPIFGLAVTGLVEIPRLKRNDTAKAGDLLYLTKPLGVGILSTAQKKGMLKPEHSMVARDSMVRLNKIGLELSALPGVNAMTDVTGFGVLGHTMEMVEGSGLSATIEYSKLPFIEGVRDYTAQRISPDATTRNWNAYSSKVKFEKGVNVMEAFSVLPDPQTNGGLLISVSEAALSTVQELLQANGLNAHTEPIGRVIEKTEPSLLIV